MRKEKYMKPLFKNITIYNSKNYNQFVKFHGEKFNFSYNMYTFLMLALMLYCIILNIIQKNILLFLVFLAMLSLTILFRMYLPVKRYQKTNKKFAKSQQTSITINFYKFYFKVEKKIYPYLKLYKVFETKDYFYLYINEDSAVLVSKNGFKFGTVEEFTEFIKKKSLFKYSKR